MDKKLLVLKRLDIYGILFIRYQNGGAIMSFVIKENRILERYIDDATEDIVIPEGVRIIGREVFACTHIKELKFPDSVHKIDYYAFNSSDICKIQLGSESQLELIMDSAFEDCKYLAEITIPASVTEIGYNAFQGCIGLEHVYFENGSKLKTICSGAFKGCKALKEIDLPNSITYIGKNAFEDCSNLEGMISIPDKCRIIDEGVFSGCFRISEINIPSELRWIEQFAFYGCASLRLISIPGNVETIGNSSFYRCDMLKEAYINNGVKAIGNCAFMYCRSLETVELPQSITYMGESSFEYCVSLTQLKLPNIRVIKDRMFRGCKLKHINIPNCICSIGKRSFESCVKLERIVFQNGLKRIEEAAFNACCQLKRITIPGSVETIEKYAFAACSKISEVTISQGVKEIRRFAFTMCFNLKRISLPSTLEHIEENVFDNDSELEEINLVGNSLYYESENGVLYRSKKEYLVRCPPKKKQIHVPYGVIGLSNDAFRECKLIEHISLPATLGILDAKSFSSCSNLECITVDDKNKSYCSVDGVLYSKDKTSLLFCPPRIKDISIPDSVKRIENDAFNGCSLLKSVVLPNGLEYIGHSAFRNCSNLASINIPASVTEFGGLAFDGTLWLKEQREKKPLVIVNDTIVDGKTCHGNVVISGASKIGELSFSRNMRNIKDLDAIISVLSNVSFSTQVKIIEKEAFKDCSTLLDSLIIPETILKIGYRAFEGCFRLKKVTIPENLLLTCGYNEWFYGDTGLTAIEVTHGQGGRMLYDSFEGAVYELDDNGKPTKLVICPPGKGEIYIPNGVKSIAENAFESCIDISELHLPTTLSFKDTAWYDKLCESKKHDGDVFIEGNNSEDYQYNKDHDSVVMVLETFFCTKDSEAYRFAKEHNINVEIDETENQ